MYIWCPTTYTWLPNTLPIPATYLIETPNACPSSSLSQSGPYFARSIVGNYAGFVRYGLWVCHRTPTAKCIPSCGRMFKSCRRRLSSIFATLSFLSCSLCLACSFVYTHRNADFYYVTLMFDTIRLWAYMVICSRARVNVLTR